MKLAIVVRKDLGMRTGKVAVQAGHASVAAVIEGNVDEILPWYNEGQKKVVLKALDENHLVGIATIARMQGLNVNEIRDFGLTQVAPDTLTCIAIGPDTDERIDAITKELSLL